MTRSLTMRPPAMLDRPMRLLTVLAMTAALFAAFLSAPTVSAGVETPTASLTFQVYTCPDDYTGEDYLTDCAAGPAGYELLVTENTDSADGPGGQPGVTGYTDAAGFYSANYPAGPTRAVLQLSQESNSFYFACFDTTSSSEVFLVDGAANGLSLETAGGESFSCRWYVIPSSAGEPAPTTADGTFQVYDCELDDTGDAEAAGCVAAPQGIPVRINGDGGNYVQNTQTSQSGTAHDSTIPPGEITVTLDIEEVVYDRETTGFEVECFDTTSGEAVSLGTTNVGTIDLTVVAGGTYACDFYVTSYAGTASAAFQVFTCPVAYADDDYLSDCVPVDPSAPVDILLNAGTDFDFDAALTGTTGDEGRTGFEALEPGTYLATINESERVNTFYLACFDTSSGTESFLFNSTGIQFTADLAPDSLLSCRWYIIPLAQRDGASASPSATSAPSASSVASASAAPSRGTSGGPVTGLPNTGTGSTSSPVTPGAALAVAMLALLPVAFATRRLTTTRR